ncbi:hypothetical protein DSO57_1038463, partial [Entomophthora muscae]
VNMATFRFSLLNSHFYIPTVNFATVATRNGIYLRLSCPSMIVIRNGLILTFWGLDPTGQQSLGTAAPGAGLADSYSRRPQTLPTMIPSTAKKLMEPDHEPI